MVRLLHSWVQNLLYNLHVRSKLLLIYFILILIPLGLFTFFTFSRVSNVIQEQTFNTVSQAFNNAVSITEDMLNRMDDVTQILTHDQLVYQMASHNPGDYPIIEQLQDSNQLSTSFQYLEAFSKVDDIRLYVGNDYLYSTENLNIFSMNQVKDSEWYALLTNSDDSFLWSPPYQSQDATSERQHLFSLFRMIYNPVSLAEPLAVLRVDMEKNKLVEILQATPITEHGYIVLMENDRILLSTNSTQQDDYDYQLRDALNAQQQGEWVPTSLHNKDVYINHMSLPKTGWNMVTVIPYEDIFGVSTKLRTEMIIAALIITLIAYILAYSISGTSTKRLSLLVKSMRQVHRGDMDIALKPEGGDEIGQLMFNFQKMMDQIHILMEEKYRDGQEIKSLELKALQAQINPHFLYNSLDLVNCIAIRRDVPEIVKMIGALTRFYRLSLNNGKDTLPIEDELKHVQLYVQIQNMRFDDRIEMIQDVEMVILPMQTIKIILQPIVENAIQHGIFKKKNRSGNITISGKREMENIIIQIHDDGVGMSQEMHSGEKLPTGVPTEHPDGLKGGYGLRNINDRLKLAYGEEYGITFASTPGVGTTVTVKIPVVYP